MDNRFWRVDDVPVTHPGSPWILPLTGCWLTLAQESHKYLGTDVQAESSLRGAQNREDVEFLKEGGGLKTGDSHLEVWLYEASADPGKVLREGAVTDLLSVWRPKRHHSGGIRTLFYIKCITWYWRCGWPVNPDWIISDGRCLNGTSKKDTLVLSANATGHKWAHPVNPESLQETRVFC